MVLGEVLEPKPGPQEAPRGPKTTKNPKWQNPGNQILRVSTGRSEYPFLQGGRSTRIPGHGPGHPKWPWLMIGTVPDSPPSITKHQNTKPIQIPEYTKYKTITLLLIGFQRKSEQLRGHPRFTKKTTLILLRPRARRSLCRALHATHVYWFLYVLYLRSL